MLLARNAGGLSIASFAANANGLKNIESSQAWDDYQEHDAGKEVVEIHRIDFDISLLASFLGVSGSSRLVWMFRPGTLKVNTPTTDLDIETFRKMLTFPTPSWYQGAAPGVVSRTLNVSATFPEPVIADPYSNIYGCLIESDCGAFPTFGDFDLQFRVWYRWVKANQANLQAYMGWEAQGV